MKAGFSYIFGFIPISLQNDLFKMGLEKIFYYNSAPCLYAIEIIAFINFQNLMMSLRQLDTTCSAWYSYESNYCTSLVASTVCNICDLLPLLYWVEINHFTIRTAFQHTYAFAIFINAETPVIRKWKREGKRKQIASGLATHCEQNQQQISIHEYISSGHYCAVMEPSAPVCFQPPVTRRYLTLMKNAAMFQSPQHYHSVFAICWDQMTPKCRSSMINVVLYNIYFALNFCVFCIGLFNSL